ncbi:hypothetical protein E2562_031590 [Oryza meyeriana var. granulata]|uniref:Uncharacterized protein n=1 Tax=Oryza meyeriana var. granulata TaxID=110450 RepID=A0A6G1CJR1_9ORYZ|nr:hypothetical protein E2562_031590 [Oryza meyeriana var. granulata]
MVVVRRRGIFYPGGADLGGRRRPHYLKLSKMKLSLHNESEMWPMELSELHDAKAWTPSTHHGKMKVELVRDRPLVPKKGNGGGKVTGESSAQEEPIWGTGAGAGYTV